MLLKKKNSRKHTTRLVRHVRFGQKIVKIWICSLILNWFDTMRKINRNIASETISTNCVKIESWLVNCGAYDQ